MTDSRCIREPGEQQSALLDITLTLLSTERGSSTALHIKLSKKRQKNLKFLLTFHVKVFRPALRMVPKNRRGALTSLKYFRRRNLPI